MRETSTSPGPASPSTRAAMWTAMPAYVRADALALAGVDPGAHRDAGGARALGDLERAAHRAGRAVEGGEEAVAERLDLLAAVAGERGAHERVMAVEQLAPAAVADLRGPLGRADDVREQDGGEHALGRPRGARAGHELLHLVDDRLDLVEEAAPSRVPGSSTKRAPGTRSRTYSAWRRSTRESSRRRITSVGTRISARMSRTSVRPTTRIVGSIAAGPTASRSMRANQSRRPGSPAKAVETASTVTPSPSR